MRAYAADHREYVGVHQQSQAQIRNYRILHAQILGVYDDHDGEDGEETSPISTPLLRSTI